MENIESQVGEREKSIRKKINDALLNAPSVLEAKLWVNNLSTTPDAIQFAPGVCSFDNADDYRNANKIIDEILSGSPSKSQADDVDHEIEHFLKAQNLGCNANLCFVFGIDNKKHDSTTGMLTWNKLWNKAFTFFSRPNGVNDERWREIKTDVYGAPSDLSKGDKRGLKQLKK